MSGCAAGRPNEMLREGLDDYTVDDGVLSRGDCVDRASASTWFVVVVVFVLYRLY
jgi:hypothetical protein